MSPDGSQTWVVYHATPDSGDGWNKRKARCQLVDLKSGLPNAGLYPLAEGTSMPVPGGTVIPQQNKGTVPAIAVSRFVASANPSSSPEMVANPQSANKSLKGNLVWQNLKKSVGTLKPRGRWTQS